VSGGSRPAYKVKIETLESEVASLREALGLEKSDSPEGWGIHATQELRDRMAASALIAEKLDEPRALKRLGINLRWKEGGKYLDPIVWEWCRQIFGTPGVQKQLAIDMTDAEKNKTQIIARLVETACHGEEGNAIRAAGQLAKMADWNEGDKAVAKAGAAQIISLMQLASDAPRRVKSDTFDASKPLDAEKFLSYEPSEQGTLVSDTDEVHA
jgi:hypothetical protein